MNKQRNCKVHSPSSSNTKTVVDFTSHHPSHCEKILNNEILQLNDHASTEDNTIPASRMHSVDDKTSARRT